LFLKPLVLVLFVFLLAPASAFCPDTDVIAVKDLVPTKDAELVQYLQNILDSYRYTENYSVGRFDNMDTIVITTRILQDNGFNPSTIARYALKGRSGESHMWLAVPDGGGRFAFIETTAFASGIPTLGKVVDAGASAEYTSGNVLLDPMQAMRCFGYADDRFLADIHKVEQIRSVPARSIQIEKSEWIYQASITPSNYNYPYAVLPVWHRTWHRECFFC
jgi:hypothetical protein